jgi:hypothetical protein
MDMGYRSPKQKMADGEYRFKIGAYTPATMPMARIAEYMRDLAVLLGEPEYVHFVKLQKGSTALVHRVNREAVPKVEERTAAVRDGHAPRDAMQAKENINRRLRDDNTSGALIRGTRATIIRFPGREEVEEDRTTFSEEGSIDGIPIVVGGEGDPCPVHLRSSDNTLTYLCDVDRNQAKKLATYLFDTEIRAHGIGRWVRDERGSWSLDRFRIKSFDPLSDLPLSAVVATLRTIPGSQWPSVEDPWAELDRIRHGPDPEDNGETKNGPHK